MENKQQLLDALLGAKEAFDTARSEIDELHGRLYELIYETVLEEIEDEDVESLKEEIEHIYEYLPTWDTIDNMIERIEEVQKQVVKCEVEIPED